MTTNLITNIPSADDYPALKRRFQAIAETEFMKHAIATTQGGLGDNFADLIKAHRHIGQVSIDTGLILSLNAHLWGAVFPLLTYGTSAQQQQWLQPLLNAQLIGGHAITEPQAGSDINAMQAVASKTETGFLLNAHKRFITNTPIADLLLVYARLEDQISVFVVTKQDPDVQFCAETTVNACKTASMGDVILEQCLLPADRLLGKIGAGSFIMQQALELERAFIFAGISGIMQWQLDEVIKFSRERQVLGQHLGKNQAISHQIAAIKLRLDSVNLWLNECARLKDQNQRLTLASAETKLFSAEVFLQSSLDTVQIMGATGLESNQRYSELVLDAMSSRLFSGSSEIQKNIIAALLGTGEGFKGKK